MNNPNHKGSRKEKLNFYDLSQDESVKKILDQFIEDLPNREKQVIRLRYWSNMNFYEISDCLNVRVSTVEKFLMSGIKRLKQRRNLIVSVFEENEEEKCS